MSQRERVLEYMQLHGEITSLDAFNNLGIVSLPRRILDLRQQGHSIKVERVTGRNRYGDKVCYNRYLLEKEAYVRQLSTAELEPASGDWTQDTTLFEINWRDDVITLEHNVEYRGVFYEIVRVDFYEGYKDTIKITAKQLNKHKRPGPDDIVPYG